MSSARIAWVTCPTCGKRAYYTRKDARTIARRIPGEHLNAYRCGNGWHLGHLPAVIRTGHTDRSAARNRPLAGGAR